MYLLYVSISHDFNEDFTVLTSVCFLCAVTFNIRRVTMSVMMKQQRMSFGRRVVRIITICSLWVFLPCCLSLEGNRKSSLPRVTRYESTKTIRRQRETSSGSIVSSLPKNGSGAFLNIRGGSTTALNHAQAKRRRRLTLLLVATALFNDTLQLTMILPIIHTLVTSPPPLGVESNTEVALGVFFASKDICQMAFAPLAGILTAKTSPNVALVVSTVGLGLATFVFAGATTFRQLLFARAAQGVASAAVLCGGMSLVSETHTPDVRGAAIGLAQTGLALGLLCGPLIGGLLFEKVGRKRTFRFAAAAVMANAVGQLLLMGIAPPERHKASEHGNTNNKNNKKSTTAPSSGRQRLVRNRDVLAVLASTMAVHAVVGVIKPLSQVILDREFGIGMVGRSFVVTIATLTYFISTPVSGWLSDRMPRSRLIAMSLVVMALSSAFFALRGLGLWAFNVSIGLLGLSMGMAGSAGQALLADLVDRHELGEYSMVFALSDMADSLGLIVGPIVGLYLSQVFGASVGPGVMGIMCLLLAPIVLRIP
jgi:DHA1 family solute carrier family 18 vesicular amine transporter 1/2